MKGKAGVQNSNNAYMLVYMLRDTLKEVRLSEAEEKRKREILVKASRMPGALGKQVSNAGEPEEKKRKVSSKYSKHILSDEFSSWKSKKGE